VASDFQADSGRFGRREGHLAEVATLREIALRKSQNFKDRTWTFDDDGTFPGFTELGYQLSFIRMFLTRDLKVFRSEDTTTVFLLELQKMFHRARLASTILSPSSATHSLPTSSKDKPL